MTGEPIATGDDGSLSRARAAVIATIRWAYLALTAVAGAWLAWCTLVLVRARRRPPGLVLATAGVGAALVAVRLAGLAYLDLTAFQALSPSYLAPAHAVAAAVVVVASLAPGPDGAQVELGAWADARSVE